jgi:hypothetical protein
MGLHDTRGYVAVSGIAQAELARAVPAPSPQGAIALEGQGDVEHAEDSRPVALID